MTEPDGTEITGDWSDPLAAAWERHRERVFERHRLVSEWLVDQVDPQRGDTILELAAGPGETGFLAAERVGPEGRLISTDITEGMVDAARRGAQARGLGNVDCRVMDAQQLDLPNSSVDGVLCRFAFMLMPEQDRALSEARRVLRPGGRLAYAVFGAREHNPWITVFVEAIEKSAHHLPRDFFGPSGPFFSLAAPDRNRHLLRAAGFTEVLVDQIGEPRHYQDFDEYWTHHTQATGPIAALISSLTSEEAESIRAALPPMLTTFQVGEGYDIPALVTLASAT